MDTIGRTLRRHPVGTPAVPPFLGLCHDWQWLFIIEASESMEHP
jgi:hypothetical protein